MIIFWRTYKGHQQVFIYDLRPSNNTPLLKIDSNGYQVEKNTVSVGFMDKGNCIYTAGEDKMIKIWDLRFDLINFILTRFMSLFLTERFNKIF